MSISYQCDAVSSHSATVAAPCHNRPIPDIYIERDGHDIRCEKQTSWELPQSNADSYLNRYEACCHSCHFPHHQIIQTIAAHQKSEHSFPI